MWVGGGCGAWVSSLVRELKSHMPCGTEERKKKERKKGRKEGRRKEGRKEEKERRKERKKEGKKERKEEGRKMDNLFQGTSLWKDAGEKGSSVDARTQISCPSGMRSTICTGHYPSILPFLESLEVRAVCVYVCDVGRVCWG